MKPDIVKRKKIVKLKTPKSREGLAQGLKILGRPLRFQVYSYVREPMVIKSSKCMIPGTSLVV